jgi:O-antigen/teichoic acid export membrane protein
MDIACPRFLRPYLAQIETSPIGYRVAKGAFWCVIGTLISRAMGVLGSIIVARVLGITIFGEFTIIQSTVGLFGTFAGLGLGITATKYVAELRESEKTRCGRIILLTLMLAFLGGLAGGITLMIGAPWLAKHTLAAPHLSVVLQTSAFLVLFSTLQSAYTGALAGFEAFKRTAWINFVGALVGTPLLVIGAWRWSLKGGVWGISAQALAGCVVAHLALVRVAKLERIPLPFGALLRRPFKELNQEFEVLWKFSLPAFLSSMLVGPVNWTCNTLLVNQPRGYSQAALLSAANQWKNLVGFVPLMLSSAIVPILARLHATGQKEDFARMLRKQVGYYGLFCGLAIIPLVICARPVMHSYGPGFVEGVPVLMLTLCSTVLTAMSNPMSKSMQSAGKAWLELGFCALWAMALLGTSIVFIPRYLAMGVAISQLVSVTAITAWQWWFINRLPRPRAVLDPGNQERYGNRL